MARNSETMARFVAPDQIEQEALFTRSGSLRFVEQQVRLELPFAFEDLSSKDIDRIAGSISHIASSATHLRLDVFRTEQDEPHGPASEQHLQGTESVLRLSVKTGSIYAFYLPLKTAEDDRTLLVQSLLRKIEYLRVRLRSFG